MFNVCIAAYSVFQGTVKPSARYSCILLAIIHMRTGTGYLRGDHSRNPHLLHLVHHGSDIYERCTPLPSRKPNICPSFSPIELKFLRTYIGICHNQSYLKRLWLNQRKIALACHWRAKSPHLHPELQLPKPLPPVLQEILLVRPFILIREQNYWQYPL